MPFTNPFNSFMAKKKPRGSTTDELALVKAAAWAWFQHGSGSEGKPVGDFDMRRTQLVPRPSRYKLEAMRSTDSPIHADDNSLLDTYEIESISKRIDELIIEESGNRLYKKKALVSHHDDDRTKDSTNSDNKKKSKKVRGFWPLRHAILCATRQDVVMTRRAFAADHHHHHQQPERRETVVKLASCSL